MECPLRCNTDPLDQDGLVDPQQCPLCGFGSVPSDRSLWTPEQIETERSYEKLAVTQKNLIRAIWASTNNVFNLSARTNAQVPTKDEVDTLVDEMFTLLANITA